MALLLDAPLMSWGDSSPTYSVRGTGALPTLTAIHGYVACCMGISSQEDQSRYESLGYLLSFSSAPSVLNGKQEVLDDHQVSRGKNSLGERSRAAVVDTEGKYLPEGKIYHKHYLTGVVFGVVLRVEDEISSQVEEALADPYWPPFLGRKCCIPASQVFQGAFNSCEEAEEALNSALADR